MSDFPEARRITPKGKNHRFGYYEKTPWDPTGRHMPALETELYDRIPRVSDPAVIGRLRVVLIEEATSSAEIVTVEGPVFQVGTTVYLDRKMR